MVKISAHKSFAQSLSKCLLLLSTDFVTCEGPLMRTETMPSMGAPSMMLLMLKSGMDITRLNLGSRNFTGKFSSPNWINFHLKATFIWV
jgi:hypothetical protein